MPPFPPNLQIMADPGFEYNLPVIVVTMSTLASVQEVRRAHAKHISL